MMCRKWQHNSSAFWIEITRAFTTHCKKDLENAAKNLSTSLLHVEGTIYSLKNFAGAQLSFVGLELEEYEWDLIHEEQHILDDNGKIKHQSMMIRLIPNLKFMLKMLGDTMGADEIDFKKEEWWPAFRNSVKVRDRLMHPKQLSDMNISAFELDDLIQARTGFNKLLSNYLGPRPWMLEDIWPASSYKNICNK